MILLREIQQTTLPANLKPWQVFITKEHILYTPYTLKKSKVVMKMQYKRWLMQSCINNKEVLQELFRLYLIHKQYGVLEIFSEDISYLSYIQSLKEYLEIIVKENCYG